MCLCNYMPLSLNVRLAMPLFPYSSLVVCYVCLCKSLGGFLCSLGFRSIIKGDFICVSSLHLLSPTILFCRDPYLSISPFVYLSVGSSICVYVRLYMSVSTCVWLSMHNYISVCLCLSFSLCTCECSSLIISFQFGHSFFLILTFTHV